jgi:tryptophanase
MHKIRIVQKVRLSPAAERFKAIEAAGYNTFLLRTRDIFLDMLTDSGANAMSDNQQAAMMVADDAYAGSESFCKLQDSVAGIFGYKYVLPVHQGRAAEHLLAKAFVKPGHVVPMNYHFTTTRAHFELAGGTVLELFTPEALNTQSTAPFKGNMDLGRLKEAIDKHGAANFTLSHIEYVVDRLKWLLAHKDLVGGCRFIEEPPVLRFFAGRMEAIGGWGAKLLAEFQKDFGPDC